jgi:hypothetical protein
MKIASTIRIAIALLALFVSSSAFAASDYLLMIEGVKGECAGKYITLIENADGSFSAMNILPGTYKLVAKPKAADGSVKVTRQGNPVGVNFDLECIVSPRDIATGQASGRRQQNMMAIQKMNVSIPPNGVLIGNIKVGDESSTAKGQRVAGYDLKVNKKV